MRRRRSLIFLIAVGGSLVLGSYALAFSYGPEVRSGIWGGVPQELRPLYTVNMLLAAVGFFPLTWLLGFATAPEELEQRTGLSFSGMTLAYGLILIPSALWLPMTAEMIRAPSTLLWWAIRLVLLLVGVGTTVLLWMAIRRARHGPVWCWLAVLSGFFLWLQTALLDAVIWPAYYPL